MALDPISAALDLGSKLIERLWPDPQQAEAAKLKLLELQTSGELAQLTADTDLAKAQLAVNQTEAANPSVYVAGWRPAVGWVGAVSLALMYWPYAIVSTAMWTWACFHTGALQPKPDLGAADMLGLLGSLLGIAGLRTTEKIRGVATTATIPFRGGAQ